MRRRLFAERCHTALAVTRARKARRRPATRRRAWRSPRHVLMTSSRSRAFPACGVGFSERMTIVETPPMSCVSASAGTTKRRCQGPPFGSDIWPRRPLRNRTRLPVLDSSAARAGGAGRGRPARRAGPSAMTSACRAEDGWGCPATGPATAPPLVPAFARMTKRRRQGPSYGSNARPGRPLSDRCPYNRTGMPCSRRCTFRSCTADSA